MNLLCRANAEAVEKALAQERQARQAENIQSQQAVQQNMSAFDMRMQQLDSQRNEMEQRWNQNMAKADDKFMTFQATVERNFHLYSIVWPKTETNEREEP